MELHIDITGSDELVMAIVKAVTPNIKPLETPIEHPEKPVEPVKPEVPQEKPKMVPEKDPKQKAATKPAETTAPVKHRGRPKKGTTMPTPEEVERAEHDMLKDRIFGDD
jgi:hypothetical protein